MTFPTVPTSADGRITTIFNADATSPRTSPDLSTITKASGDLLIAIVIAYQSSGTANAVWSSWSAGWTEFIDSSSATTMAIGGAYKWSTGSETGTISVTQATTITGHATWFLMAIPGAHASSPPEWSSRADGTGAAANPASFNPSWAAEDILWVAVAGSGETGGTGSYTGTGGVPPTNYTNSLETGITADVVGGVAGMVGFRQLNADSEDVATFSSIDISNARNAALVIAVRPVAEVAGFPRFQTILHPPTAVVTSTVW